ncbi:PBECR2 nuclease fold domain-containing protein [Helicobacter pylori]|uniref:PBECR2 nuclease fold domain-containing protein n=1 Tax=Helicobacter pylori TaxID=210 RepID=UPI003CC866A7
MSDFSKQLDLSAKNSKFTNNTLKIIEELNNGVKQASEELKEATKTSNLVKSIREQDTRPFEVIEDKEAFFKDLNKNLEANATLLPKGMSVEEFKKSLESVENKDRFLEHLETRDNSQDRLKFLSLIEPIIREPHIEIFIKDKDGALKKEYIKAFKDENKTRLYMLITQDNDTILRTFIPKLNERYMRNHVRNADIIHSFIQPNRTAKSDNALSDVVVYGENTTKKPLTSQEDLLKTQENPLKTQENPPKTTQDLSPLEQANAEKLAKLESEKLESEKEFTRLKEQEQARKAALKKKLEHERGNAGNIESQTKIEVGEDIPMHTQKQIPKSRVRLNEREIYDLDYAIVKAKDLKPSFTTGGTQKRTDMNEEQIKSIAENFDPKKIFGSGGFEDLPIILHDGQVIAGNHRIQGMLNFTPKSRFAYERAIKEYYHIDLKPDELLVRVPSKRLNNTEINNLAASSNQGRFNSESDHAIAVLSHYEPKLKELETKLNADSIYSLKNIVAKNLNFDKATHPNVGDSNLALLMFNMPRTKTQGIELLNRWQKEFSNDIKSYEKVKKMFVDNAGSFHNLIHDLNFPSVSLNAYLSDIMDRSFANLKNYPSTSESLKDLSEKFYKMSSLEMFEKSDQSTSDISEILGGAIARFARFDDPSKALFEALKSDNIKKGLKEFKIADVTKDMFDPNSKEFKDIDIYDFTHYLLMVGREPNENNPSLKHLIQAVRDMQKENAKGIKEVSKKSAKQSEIKERAFKVIEDKEAFFKDLNAIKPMPLPREIDSFLNAFNVVENKENFIKHLKNKPDAKHRLAYLHLVEPTLKEPDITLIFKDQGKEVKKEHIKAFQGDPKTIYYFLVTQDNDSKLITGLRTSENYLKAEIDKADIIHSFIPQDS